MAKVTTIPVKSDTKQYYDALRDGQKHDDFVYQLALVWDALTPPERHRLMAESLELPPAHKRQPPAAQGG